MKQYKIVSGKNQPLQGLLGKRVTVQERLDSTRKGQPERVLCWLLEDAQSPPLAFKEGTCIELDADQVEQIRSPKKHRKWLKRKTRKLLQDKFAVYTRDAENQDSEVPNGDFWSLFETPEEVLKSFITDLAVAYDVNMEERWTLREREESGVASTAETSLTGPDAGL